MKATIINGYIIAVGVGTTDITDAEYTKILNTLANRPTSPEGYGYRLKSDLSWELYELPIIEEEQTAYTAEQLEAMTSTELKAICSEMGISGTMTKANMISLILGKQNEVIT